MRPIFFLVKHQQESGVVHPTYHPNASKFSISALNSLSLFDKDLIVSHKTDTATANSYYVLSWVCDAIARIQTSDSWHAFRKCDRLTEEVLVFLEFDNSEFEHLWVFAATVSRRHDLLTVRKRVAHWCNDYDRSKERTAPIQPENTRRHLAYSKQHAFRP